MIEPVVFPFTYLEANTVRLLLTCFNRIRVYIPTDSTRDEFVSEALENGLVDLHNPMADSGYEVDQVFKEYRQWRQANRGTDISFFKRSDSSDPFFNEDTISYLRQDILNSVPGATEKTTDLLLAARVFLRMTGNYDRVQAEVAEALLSQSEKEFSMLAALQGEDEDREDGAPEMPGTASLPADAGELMTEERLKSWAMLAGEAASPDAVFVTPSRAVFEAVRDRFENNSVMFANIPVSGDWQHRDQPVCEQWRNDLAGFLADLSRSDSRDPGNGLPPTCPVNKSGALMTIIRLAGVSPRSFMEKLCHKPMESLEIKENSGQASTIVTAVFRA